MSQQCCNNCFEDPHLQNQILHLMAKPPIDGQYKECHYCGSECSVFFDSKELEEYFGIFLECYVPVADGTSDAKSLAECIDEDWRVFNRRLPSASKNALLTDILGDRMREKGYLFSRKKYDDHSSWDSFRNELLHTNRWFTGNKIDTESLKSVITQLTVEPKEIGDISTEWYRVRLAPDQTSNFSFEEMGAPPSEKVGPGRANPPGISYLYLASDEETALAEVRPHPGDIAYIATFDISNPKSKKAIRAIDLRAPRERISPFIYDEAEKIEVAMQAVSILDSFAVQLTKPVHPDAAPIEYTPSQYLCELVKSLHYSGVIYRSSVSSGANIALFSPEDFDANPRVVKKIINKISVEATSI